MQKGKLIVIDGINNLGKTTQAKLLVNRLNSIGEKAEQTYLELAEKYKWIKINANRSIVEISDEIFTIVNLLYQS